MSLTEILTLCATALSPLIAIQVSQYLTSQNEHRERKLTIFKNLMATRAYTLSPMHVEALNRIDLEFSQNSAKEKAVLDIWQQYLDHLGQQQIEPAIWASKRTDLLVDLLYAMAIALGYSFNKTQLKNGTYAPVGHSRIEEERDRLRVLILELLEGKRDLPMRVTAIPDVKR